MQTGVYTRADADRVPSVNTIDMVIVMLLSSDALVRDLLFTSQNPLPKKRRSLPSSRGASRVPNELVCSLRYTEHCCLYWGCLGALLN
jgi:hypothetical protein